MKHLHLDKIKSYESPIKVVKIFSENEIKMIQELYSTLPERVFNKKQNIRKKVWIQNYNKDLDKLYFDKLKNLLGDFKMDTLKSDKDEDLYGIFHESYAPLKLHVDTSFSEESIIFKQIVTPLSSFGETIIFKNRWYGKSTTFTIDENELKAKFQPGINDKSCQHLGDENFDVDLYNKYLKHENIQNLKGLKIDIVYKWKLGETLIMDSSHIHCSSCNIKEKKLGLTTFTKK